MALALIAESGRLLRRDDAEQQMSNRLLAGRPPILVREAGYRPGVEDEGLH